MTKHIGIVGCSAEGAALCYKTICIESAETLGPYMHPEVSMHTHSLADYVKCLERNDLAGIGDIMLSSASKLHAAGAKFLICPDNTIHQAMNFVTKHSPLPWLHIAEVVATEASTKRYRRLGLIGTKWLVESEVYPEKLNKHGIEWVRPFRTEREKISAIIMTELIHGIFMPDSTAYVQDVIARLKNEEGCDAVVLGCTEIPLIISEANSNLPILDSTRLLARAAIAHSSAD